MKQFASGDFGSTFDESSRLDLWRQAGRMLALAPVAGVGPGGFARELPNVRFDDSESPANQATDLAGSHYLQLAAELGLVGWVLHVALLMMALGAAVRRARRVGEAAARRRSLVTASALAIVLVLLQFNHYGLFPDFAWLLGALLATCTVETEGEPTSRRFRSKSRWRLAAAATLLLVLFASAFTACGDRGYRLRSEAEEWPLRHDHGCFPVESWGGVETRWCSPSASLAVPVALPGDRAVTISVLAMHPDLESLPLAVELCTLSERCQSTTFERSEWRRLTLPIERAALRTCRGPDGRRADCLVVRVAAARGWRPADWSDSQDDRWLGVAVRLRRLPDPSLAPGHLFSDSFESASLLSWRLGDEDADPGR